MDIYFDSFFFFLPLGIIIKSVRIKYVGRL